MDTNETKGMPVDEALELADLLAQSLPPGVAGGWRREACKTLADEVRKMRAECEALKSALRRRKAGGRVMLAKLICSMFGHAPLTTSGWKGGVGYARICAATTDGMGVGHLYLIADCPRCGKTYEICNVHAKPPKPEGA